MHDGIRRKNSVENVEVGARDGLQREPDILPTEKKVALIQAAIVTDGASSTWAISHAQRLPETIEHTRQCALDGARAWQSHR